MRPYGQNTVTIVLPRGNELIVQFAREIRCDRGPSMRGNLPAKATYTRDGKRD